MMLAGSVREVGRKGPARRLRAEGKLPGVVYGLGENVCVAVSSRDVIKILESGSGANTIITTKFDGDAKERRVMIKELDIHPLTDDLVHIDFLEIDLNKPVRATIPINYTGVAKGVKEKGGKLNIQKHGLNIECMPKNIPDVINVPLANLDAGEELLVKDLEIGEGVTPLEDMESIVVSVLAPRVAETKAEGEEGAEGEGAAESPASAEG